MQDLTPPGRQAVEDVARRHGVSADAAVTLLRALAAGGGTQAQFSHPELGGMGQWSQGGMTMVGDMFNHGLKARVDALCQDLAALLRGASPFAPSPAAQSQSQSQSSGGSSQYSGGAFQSSGGGAGVSLFIPGQGSSGGWWPAELGSPASSGAQNSTRYATFPAQRRLAISQGGHVTVYDTGDHHITGFSQSQGGDQSLTFTSQHGVVRVAELPVVGPRPGGPASSASPAPHPVAPVASREPDAPRAAPAAPSRPQTLPPLPPMQAQDRGPGVMDDPIAKLERLADLRQKGILTEEEFAAKKAELLSRL